MRNRTQKEVIIRGMTLSYISGKIGESMENTEEIIGSLLERIPIDYIEDELIGYISKTSTKMNA